MRPQYRHYQARRYLSPGLGQLAAPPSEERQSTPRPSCPQICQKSTWKISEAGSIEPSDVVHKPRSDTEHGLTDGDVENLRSLHGSNEVGVKEDDPSGRKKILEQSNDPMMLLLLGSVRKHPAGSIRRCHQYFDLRGHCGPRCVCAGIPVRKIDP